LRGEPQENSPILCEVEDHGALARICGDPIEIAAVAARRLDLHDIRTEVAHDLAGHKTEGTGEIEYAIRREEHDQTFRFLFAAAEYWGYHVESAAIPVRATRTSRRYGRPSRVVAMAR